MSSSTLPSTLRVRRALGRLRRSAAVERTTGFLALHERRARQRLRARFVRGVWLRTADYLARGEPETIGTFHAGADAGSRTVVGAPTFVPGPPADPPGDRIVVDVPARGWAGLKRPWVVGTNGTVLGRDRRLLWDLSYEWPGRAHLHSAYGLTDLSAVELPGRTLTLAAMAADQNYFHFLLNGVARLAYLPEAGAALAPDRYLISGQVTPFVRSTLALFGVPADRLIGTAEFAAARPELLIAPPLVHHPFVVPAPLCEFVRTHVERVLPPVGRPRRRLFIDRGDAATRHVSNLDELQPLFAECGLETVQLANLSLLEQAQLFREAELIIANHGAALTNLVFCVPGTRVLQLLAPGMMEREYRTLSQHGRLRHDYLVASFATTADAHLPRKDRDLILPPALLRAVLVADSWIHR